MTAITASRSQVSALYFRQSAGPCDSDPLTHTPRLHHTVDDVRVALCEGFGGGGGCRFEQQQTLRRIVEEGPTELHLVARDGRIGVCQMRPAKWRPALAEICRIFVFGFREG